MFNRKLEIPLEEQRAELAGRQAVIDAIERATARIEFAPDGTILFVNDLFLATMKYRSEAVLGKNHRMFRDDACANSSEYLALWQRLRRGEYFSGRLRRLARNRRTVWLEADNNARLATRDLPPRALGLAGPTGAAGIIHRGPSRKRCDAHPSRSRAPPRP